MLHPHLNLLVGLATGRRLGIVASSGSIDLAVATAQKLGPNLDDHVMWENLETRNFAFGGFLDRQAEWDGNRARTGRPGTNVRRMRTNRFRERGSAPTSASKVSFQVHDGQYSDSLNKSNSESRIYLFSVLLCNSFR